MKQFLFSLYILLLFLVGGDVLHAQAIESTPDIIPTPPPMPTSERDSMVEQTQERATSEREEPTPEAESTPGIADLPDECEDNNTQSAACSIPINAVSGPFTFLPAGDTDWFSAHIGETNGLDTEITIRSNDLDIYTTIYANGQPVQTMSSPTISTTLSPDITGLLELHVENRTPSDPAGSLYNIEIRQVLPVLPQTDRINAPELLPDPLEDNYGFDQAPTIGTDYVYTLNFVCPASWDGACAGGDHDFLQLPTVKGKTYVMGTFNLAPGVNTDLAIFYGDESTPVAHNDDAGPIGFASLVRWTAPDDGYAIVRIGPRHGGMTPIVFDPEASQYQFAVALEGSDIAQQIEERVREQTQRPTPEPVASPPQSMPNGRGSLPANGSVVRPPNVQPSQSDPTPTITATITATNLLTTTPQPLEQVDIAELAPLTTPTVTSPPQIMAPLTVRTGYDRNENRVIDVDEGIRGLVVYVVDSNGQLVGEGITDQTGIVTISIETTPDMELTVTVPYFAAAQRVSASRAQTEPIIIEDTAALPAVLP